VRLNVRGSDGHPLQDLKASEVKLRVDGKEVAIEGLDRAGAAAGPMTAENVSVARVFFGNLTSNPWNVMPRRSRRDIGAFLSLESALEPANAVRDSKGGFLFASGQIPLDPKTGELVSGAIEQSAERVFDNLEAVLKAAGLTFADVVKTTVYLTKAEDFTAMNGVYGRRMGEHKPARSTVIVAALPRSAPMEIDLVARAR
jgi:2-iminobutanoate/2-iminopropanoate deaminase